MGRFICPRPEKWHEIFRILAAARKQSNDQEIDKVPEPLILSAWAHSDDWERELRWHEYLEWAEEYGFSHLIPPLAEDESHFG